MEMGPGGLGSPRAVMGPALQRIASYFSRRTFATGARFWLGPNEVGITTVAIKIDFEELRAPFHKGGTFPSADVHPGQLAWECSTITVRSQT